jgi:hypothetical protein
VPNLNHAADLIILERRKLDYTHSIFVYFKLHLFLISFINLVGHVQNTSLNLTYFIENCVEQNQATLKFYIIRFLLVTFYGE